MGQRRTKLTVWLESSVIACASYCLRAIERGLEENPSHTGHIKMSNPIASYKTQCKPGNAGLYMHYENKPIPIYTENSTTKRWFSDKKKIWYFPYFCSKHRLWYSIEPPRRGASNEYPQSVFWAEIRKIMYTPVYYIKMGFEGVKII